MKRMLILLLSLLCLCVGATALAEEKERETIALGSKGQLVVRIQQRLMDLGFYSYKPTGSYQAVTRRAALATNGRPMPGRTAASPPRSRTNSFPAGRFARLTQPACP